MAIWSHTWMLANIVYSFEYGQLSTHNQNVGVQEMTSVAPRPTPSQSCVQRTAIHYILQLLHSIPPIRLKGIAFKTI